MSSLAPAIPHPDAEARRRALAVECSFLVRAPAGSGKTELLIQRFLALLAIVTKPENVVAITFTRKAAGEMQSRILTTLDRAAKGVVPETPHERLSHELAIRALEQDRRMEWKLIDHPSRMRIQTIDSLCSSITRQMPWLTRFGSQPSVKEDADELFVEAARRTIAQIEEDVPHRAALASILAHLDNNIPRAVRLISEMLCIRDQWLPLVAGEEVRRQDLETAMQNAIVDILSRASAQVPQGLQAHILDLAKLGDRDVPKWPGCTVESHAAWLTLADMLLTSKHDWRRRPERGSGFPANSAARQLHIELVQTLRSNEDLREALRLIRSLPPPRYTDDQWQTMAALFKVLVLAVAHLKLVFRERSEVDFCEIVERARLALGRADVPSELALGLDARVQHLLVDEFQDTSVAQFDLIEKLTAGWQQGDGRTLFLVGDPMQSIYRFRQAEVGLFLRTADNTIGEIRPECLVLKENHRSDAGIVERVNEIFSRILPALNDIGTGAVAYSPFAPARPAETDEAVTLHPFRKGQDADEANLVARLVLRAQAQDPGGSIAVLVRARTHLPKIVEALKNNGIAFRAVDIDPLSTKPAVRDLMALTRAMLHLGDRPSWLAILRAPWCGLTLADLHALVGGQPKAAIWDLLRGDLMTLSPEGRERASRMAGILQGALAQRRRRSLRPWIERTWAALGGPACLVHSDNMQDAADYLDLVERHETAGDLADFDRFRIEVEKLYAQPDSSAGGVLQLLTIHKAKGLQFDTVIVPGIGRIPRREDPALLLSAERPRPNGGVDRLLATIREMGGDRDPVYEYLRELEQQKEHHEWVRLLYVAMTRARKRLHLLGHVRQYADGDIRPEKRSLLALLWSGLPDDDRERFRAVFTSGIAEAASADRPTGIPLRRLPLAWTPPPLPEPVVFRSAPAVPAKPSYLWVGDQLRHVGTVVHTALERVARNRSLVAPQSAIQSLGREGALPLADARGSVQYPSQSRDREAAVAYRLALANLGVLPAELDEAVCRVEEAVARTLASEKGSWILAPHKEARCEYAIAGILDGEIVRGTIDRTFLDEDGIRWIIDYKTSSHEGGALELFLDEEQRRYRPQLEQYARLLATAGRHIRLGLYFPLLDGWREWAPDSLSE